MCPVDDYGIEVLKKAGEQDPDFPSKAGYRHVVRVDESVLAAFNTISAEQISVGTTAVEVAASAGQRWLRIVPSSGTFQW